MMTFTDSQGHPWRIDVTVGTLLDIKTQLGLDLLDGIDNMPDTIERWVDVIWVTLADQVVAQGLNERDFAKRLLGDTLQDAIDAWLKEYAAFFLRIQPARSRAVTQMWQASKRLNEITADQIGSALGQLFTDWQVPSESTQAT